MYLINTSSEKYQMIYLQELLVLYSNMKQIQLTDRSKIFLLQMNEISITVKD